jgi:hypothetical protein
MIPIHGDGRASTWLAAARHLTSQDNWEAYNVVLEVRRPMKRDAYDRAIEERVDQFLEKAQEPSLFTVSETIFPAAEYRRHGPEGVYTTYPDTVYPTIKRLPELHWGTYAHRLVRRVGSNGVTINPLKAIVEKLQKQLAGRSVKTAQYELSLSEGAFDLPLYEALTDRNYQLGGPCLSHVSLKVTRDRKLLLTAVYRSHYYVQKALGNLLGLARLQAFICEQTNLEPGSLVCLSTHAILERQGTKDDHGWGKAEVSALLADLAGLSSGGDK